MRWSRRAHERPAHTTDEAAVAERVALQEAIEEARKGTAARHPALVVTPDRKAHAGAFIDGRFVEAAASASTGEVSYSAEQRERDVAAGEVPGENEAMRQKWWRG